jgi:2-iminobutanoate/2-iminopropanoate deaminase
MPRTAVTSPTATSVGPYSHAVDDGHYVFCSGQTPMDPATGRLRTGGIREQTLQCFENLFAVLAAAGLTPDDVVKVNVFLTDMGDFTAMNEVYATRFQRPFPARTTIGVSSLPLGADIEIELVAKRP